MSAMPMDEATRRQVDAANPDASTWLSANAGSGKTRVLTDRVARLLLRDVPPENILCLTYTKAAASEMQNRLFRRLGEWAMLEDDDLRAALGGLGVSASGNSETLGRARRLFARAIETPGGLKIQTIHSFCAGLLRRFPLEAGVSPGFTELDEEATGALLSETLDAVAEKAPEIFAEMAALVSDADLTGLAADISAKRRDFPEAADPAAIHAFFGLPEAMTEDDAFAELSRAVDPAVLEAIAEVLMGESPTMVSLAADLRIVATEGLTPETFQRLEKRCLYASGEQALTPKASALTKGARRSLGPLADDFDEIAAGVARTRQALLALEAARRTLALHRFACVFLPEYARRKEAGGWLDFDDQIGKAEALLSRPGVADWVLYRLDGSIDHILVDEAQDTSPLQWRVIEHLSREFTAGQGSDATGSRSIFVVGDVKQSIYSFQGADPSGFSQMQADFAARLGRIGQPLQQLELKHSFRSAAPILDLVDCVFGPDNARGMGGAVGHVAFRDEMPGRIDLWPVVQAGEAPETREWYDPVDQVSEEHHFVRLAVQVAAQIREMLRDGLLWEQSDGGFVPRRITEGDVLILVQRRNLLFHEIIRACKIAGLQVAGADVLKLGEELAVRDIRACLSFLSTPEDDLSLAALLRSPLFGWSEADLYDLAASRGEQEFLWQALRKRGADFPETFAILSDLRNEADYLRPFDLIERLLTRHDGRRKLLARLGDEAADGIDALLAQALAYEQKEAPSLTGFLARMEGAEIDVKRRAEGRGSKIRVMTVHGAKGLESPIVILPDTGQRRTPHEFRDNLLPGPEGMVAWSGPRAESPRVAQGWRAEAIARREEESQRLLYVAMTRAEQWLIVAAAGDLGNRGDSWYEQIRDGMIRAGATERVFEDAPGLRLELGNWGGASEPPTESAAPLPETTLPDWAARPAAVPPRPAQILSPSELGGAKALPGEAAGLSEEAAKTRGTRIHLLLEHLPRHPRKDWPALAPRLLPDADPATAQVLLAEARTVLDTGELAFLFAPEALSEVDVTAALPALGDRRIHGTIDRLLIRQDGILAVDFKTNAIVPDAPAMVPDGLLRQMGAYSLALRQIFPGRKVETAILWTGAARLMSLPDHLVEEALTRAGAS